MKNFIVRLASWVLGVLFLIFIYFLISILLRYLFLDTVYKAPSLSPRETLDQEGVIRLPHILSELDIEILTNYGKTNKIIDAKRYIIQSPKIRRAITDLLGEEYVFQDYIFFIKKSQFHTCHRDYNGDFYNAGQRYPSYTILFYLTEMGNCLDVLPASHRSWNENYNWTDKTKSMKCSRGDAILFNANLVHNGSLNETTFSSKNMRIQMKLTHGDDQKTLDFYNNYNKVLDQDDSSPLVLKQMQKHVTCQFPILSRYIKQYDRNTTTAETPVPITSVFSHLFPVLLTISE
jgi:hypothetical protein